MIDNYCSFCGSFLQSPKVSNNYKIAQCPKCGKWIMHCDYLPKLSEEQKHKIKEYLFYHKNDGIYCLIGTENDSKDFRACGVTYRTAFISFEAVDVWYPKSFSERIDYILLKLADLSLFPGDYVLISKIADELFFLVDKNTPSIPKGTEKVVQQNFIIKYLLDEQYSIGIDRIQLLSKGWARVYELQKTQSTNKDVFVSMAFNDGTKETRDAIIKGIKKAGFSADLIDEIIHNKQIVPEMLRLIKECRFLIMDITEPNFGAYYEAGYAAGLGKEVIITCKEEVFSKKDFKCPTSSEDKDCFYYAKSLKPHFDIAQKQILRWKNADDLSKQLTEWIKYLFPTN